MVYLENIDDYNLKISQGGSVSQIRPKITLEARKDETGRMWVENIYSKEAIIISKPVGEVSYDGTVYGSADDLVDALNESLGSKLNYEPELITYMDGLTTPLSSEQRTKLNDFIKALKDGLNINALSDFSDVIRIRANETAESALRNIVKRSHDATAVNSPTFTEFEGFKGNGTSSYINENYTPSTDAVNYKLNDACVLTYIRDNVAETKADLGARVLATNRALYFISRSADVNNPSYARINADGSTGLAESCSDSRGMWALNRASSTEFSAYRNKALVQTVQGVSGTLPVNRIYSLVLNQNGSPLLFSTRQNSLLIICKSLTVDQIGVITDAFEAYMDSNGKGVIA